MPVSYIEERCGQSDKGQQFLANLNDRVNRYIEANLADKHFKQQLYGNDEHVFHERLWELNLAEILIKNGLSITSKDAGPDFLALVDDMKYWFEAISPSPRNIPDIFIHPPTDPSEAQAIDFPQNEILLRITSAIRDKSNKFKEYLEKGIIGSNDVCIIAIDTSKLGFAACIGISQHPVILEATYPVGPIAVSIDRDTGEIIARYQSYRSHITKHTKSGEATISTELFISDEHKHISAVLCSSGSTTNPAIYTVHNHSAANHMKHSLLTSECEYVPSIEDGHLFLKDISHNKQNEQ